MNTSSIFEKAVQLKSSDILLTAGAKPFVRTSGEFIPMEEFPVLKKPDTVGILGEIYPDYKLQEDDEHSDLNFSYAINGLSRFRINAFRQRGSIVLAVRIISHTIPDLGQLYLPSYVKKISMASRGLFVFSGIAGSGKTTTMSAVLKEINKTRHCHILTLENPIEYLHSHEKSVVNQREIGSDVSSFIEGLNSAAKAKVDIIMLSELQGKHVIERVFELVENGHFIMVAFDSSSSVQTLERIIEQFPTQEQNQVWSRLANIIEGVICQYLIGQKGKENQIPVAEILSITDTARNLLADGKITQIRSLLKGGNKHNMQSFQSALEDLYKRGLIERDLYEKQIAFHNRRERA